MTLATPRLDELPDVFPVFPLGGALLLPRGRLPLNIFEARYLALIEDSLASGRMFGMIQPDATRPAGDTGPALFRVGCLGRLASWSETDDGRYLITLAGLVRFSMVEEVEPRRGYRRMRGVYRPYAADLAQDEPAPGYDRPKLLAALRAYFAHRGFDANWDAIDEMSDDGLVVTLCMVCPFEAAAKQALLEAPGPAERAETLLTLLHIETHAPAGDAPDAAPNRSRAS